MDQRIAPSVQIEAAIEAALLNGTGGPDQLSQLGWVVTVGAVGLRRTLARD